MPVKKGNPRIPQPNSQGVGLWQDPCNVFENSFVLITGRALTADCLVSRRDWRGNSVSCRDFFNLRRNAMRRISRWILVFAIYLAFFATHAMVAPTFAQDPEMPEANEEASNNVDPTSNNTVEVFNDSTNNWVQGENFLIDDFAQEFEGVKAREILASYGIRLMVLKGPLKIRNSISYVTIQLIPHWVSKNYNLPCS
jgi:hypothetical protein